MTTRERHVRTHVRVSLSRVRLCWWWLRGSDASIRRFVHHVQGSEPVVRAHLPSTPRHAPPHSDAAHRAITAELVRLTLGGGPERWELRTDLGGRAAHAARRLQHQLRTH